MNKILCTFFLGLFISVSSASFAAYESKYDAINFKPAVDATDYYTVYGSQTLKSWVGNFGFYLDYADRPLEFRGTGGTTGRQSVLDRTLVADVYGAYGFTDWLTVGANIPFVPYNWYYTDDVNALEDFGGSMGDIMLITKLRLINISKHKFGVALVPYVTFPTGDTERYSGSGHIMAGGKLVLDARLHERFSLSVNGGYLMRDDTTINYVFPGGATSQIFMDDLLTYGGAMNFRFTRNFQGIIEAQGSTVASDFFSTTNTTSLETDGGLRFYIGDSGFSIDVGGGVGLIEGVGSPRFRVFGGLRWIAPEPQSCPPPEPYKIGDVIVTWGKVFFDTAKATIKPESYAVLDPVVQEMQTHPEITLVEVQGHTDWRGSDQYNQKLSDARANSVMNYLISKGVSSTRLKAVGYGEARPIASNETVEGMSQNRRTVFYIVGSTAGYRTEAETVYSGTGAATE